MLVLPATLLDYANKLKIILGLSVILFCLLFLEDIQNILVQNSDYDEPRENQIMLIKIASVSAFVFLTSGFVFFRRVNQRFEKRINRLLNKEISTNTELQAANEKLEESNQKISELLHEIKETNNNLIASKAELEEAYDELKSAEMLTRERALEIERQKEQIEQNHKAIIEKNQLLADAQQRIAEANEELKASNSSLEETVNERTAKLRHANEELLLANQELDLFIYRASHDLRGPIASILGLTKIAKLEEQRSAQISYLEMLEKTANNANEVLSKLLLVNIVNQAAEHEIIDFKEMKEHIHQIFDHRFQLFNISFSLQVKDIVELKSDANLLFIVCERLIENALDFRCNRLDEKPYLKIFISAESENVVFEFKDNGIGIFKNFYQRIFGMFFRASERSQGNGLGLYIAKKASEKLGAQIQVESEIDVGSSFKLIIPRG
jgi:K+-sensing histidine kinase KdpD